MPNETTALIGCLREDRFTSINKYIHSFKKVVQRTTCRLSIFQSNVQQKSICLKIIYIFSLFSAPKTTLYLKVCNKDIDRWYVLTPRTVQERPSLSHVQFSISCDLLFGPVIKLALFPGKFKPLPNRPHGYARSGLRGQVGIKLVSFG